MNLRKNFNDWLPFEDLTSRIYPNRKSENRKLNESILLKRLEKYQKYLEDFLSFEIPSPLSNELKESAIAWCSYMIAKERFNIVNGIMLEYEKEDGLRDKIEDVRKYIDSINDFDKESFEAVKKIGYTNHMSQIKKSFYKMTSYYEELSEYSNKEYDVQKISAVKGFISIECEDIPVLMSIPQAYDHCGKAAEDIKNGNEKTYGSISSTCSMLNELSTHEESINTLKQRKEEYVERKKKILDAIEKALTLYKQLSEIFCDEDWFLQFNPSEESEAAQISNIEDLISFYNEKLKPLFVLEKGE